MKRRSCLFTFCTGLLLTPALVFLPGLAAAKSIGKDQVNIRSGPSTSSNVVFEAPLGYPIEVVKEKSGWVQFRDWENNTGWVYKPLISNVKTAVILVEKANLRSTGSVKAKVVGKAEIGEIYKILTSKGGWSQLGYYYGGAPAGWIRNDLIFGD